MAECAFGPAVHAARSFAHPSGSDTLIRVVRLKVWSRSMQQKAKAAKPNLCRDVYRNTIVMLPIEVHDNKLRLEATQK